MDFYDIIPWIFLILAIIVCFGSIIISFLDQDSPERFITIFDDGSYCIIVDINTNVQYLVFNDYREGGITVLVDVNGDPLLYKPVQ